MARTFFRLRRVVRSAEIEFENASGMRSGGPLARLLADGYPAAPGEMVERHHAEPYRYALGFTSTAPRDGPSGVLR